MVASEIEFLLQSPDTTWNAERWEKLPYDDNRYEVIDGVLYRSTTPKVFHQWVVGRMLEFVGLSVRVRDLAYSLTGPVGVFMRGCEPVQPDFVLVRKERASIIGNGRFNDVPDLIVEVISRSHPQLDATIKRAAYARAGLPEYWLARPATRDIMIYWQPEPDFGDFAHSMLAPAGGVLESPTLPISQRVADFFDGSPDTTL